VSASPATCACGRLQPFDSEVPGQQFVHGYRECRERRTGLVFAIREYGALATEVLVKPREAAYLLSVDPKTVTRWANKGKIVCIRTLGGHRRYPMSEIIRIRNGSGPA
jgi:excisionase family DNA binding protein